MTERIAAMLRQNLEASGLGPEGLELYRWYWVPATAYSWRIPLPGDMRTYNADPSLYVPPTIVEIRPRLWATDRSLQARIGWDKEERIAILFFANGGRDLTRSVEVGAVTDTGMHAIADSGAELLSVGMWERLRDMVDRLRWLEGEDEVWKDGA